MVPILKWWEGLGNFRDYLRSHQSNLWLFVAAGVPLLLLRYLLLDFESGDYKGNLIFWYRTLETEGFAAFKTQFAEYPPLYLYMLYISTFIPIEPVKAIKLWSIFFELPAAWFIFKIIRSLVPNRRDLAYVATLLFLAMPTVVMNGALWAQCDVQYTAMLLGALYYFMNHKTGTAMIFLGLAFSFKLQASFLLLVPLFYFLRGKLSALQVISPILVFIVTVIPAALAGGDLYKWLFIYQKQSGMHEALTLFAPNIWQFVGWADITLLTPVALAITLCIVVYFSIWILKTQPKVNADFILHTAFLSCLILPYFLPRMHDRYFFPADVISLIYVIRYPRRWYIALALSCTSSFSYFYFLFSTWEAFPFKILGLVNGVVLALVLKDYFTYYYQTDDKRIDQH